MYIYAGWLYYSPYALWVPVYLVVEGDFRLGAPVRTFWKWTVDGQGNKNQDKLCWGTIDRADYANLPSASMTFGIFYDLYYPFDLVFTDPQDLSKIAVTMYEFPKSDPNCRQIATFDLQLSYPCRTAAPDYDPIRALPATRYCGLGYWFDNLFAMILPDNVCSGTYMWCTFDDNEYVYYWVPYVTVVSQDENQFTITFTVSKYWFKMSLNKDDDGWYCLEWECNQDTEDKEAQQTLTADPLGLSFKLKHDSRRIAAGSVHKDKLTGISGPPRMRPSSNRSSSSDHAQDLQLQPFSHFADEISTANILRNTTTVKNDTDEAVFCTLEESSSTTKSKFLASLGWGVTLIGMFPIGSFAVPVAALGMLLASAGLYDTVNDAGAEAKMLLLPDEDMERTTTNGLPIFDKNDLSLIHVKVDDSTLTIRSGLIEKLGNTTINLSSVLQQKDNFKTLMQLTWKELRNQVIQTCKLVKVKGIPVYGNAQKLPEISREDHYDLADGKIFFHASKSEEPVLYDTLISSPSKWDKLFTFDTDSSSDAICTNILVYAYVKNSTRQYSVVRVPGTRVNVVRLKCARIQLASGVEGDNFPGGQVEGDVYNNMARISGYYAYSWTWNHRLVAYNLSDLSGAHIEFTDNRLNIVYISTCGWMPWQRLVQSS